MKKNKVWEAVVAILLFVLAAGLLERDPSDPAAWGAAVGAVIAIVILAAEEER
jgi:chromate transport protein ChrA